MNLEKIDTEQLEVVTNHYDLRKDIHTYIDYLMNRYIKRTVRENTLPKTEARRLAKLLSPPNLVKEIEAKGQSKWLNFVDWLALNLDLVFYESVGIYVGFSSMAPSYPDNYIDVQEKKYADFTDQPLQKQETALLNSLVDNFSYSGNEFFQQSLLGRLDNFSMSGCATGVIPDLNFAQSRKILLDILATCQADVWYSVSSLVQYLKSRHPFFLIPKKPKFKYYSRYDPDRYVNFTEINLKDYSKHTVSSQEADSFERVEGRFVERFLEGIPLTLGYVQLAYGQAQDPDIKPGLHQLQAFKVNNFFLDFKQNRLLEPKVIIEPNFEIQVESPIYPSRIFKDIGMLTDCKRLGTVSTLKLNRKKVASAIAKDETLDVKDLLKKVSNADLPQNVNTELEEWIGQADAFTLYQGFGILETDKPLPGTQEYIVENIEQGIELVKHPKEVFKKLEQAEFIPVFASHNQKSLRSLPEKAQSKFPQKTRKKTSKNKKPELVLKSSTEITIYCSDKQGLEILRQALIKAQCPFTPNQEVLAISYLLADQKEFEAAIQNLKTDYKVKIQNIDS